MCIAAAIVGGALIGAVGVGIAGSEAAGATTSAANTAAGVQEQALSQEATLSAPYRALGQSAIPQLQTLLGLTGGPGGAAKEETALASTPGYQFAKTQGLEGVTNSAAAGGMLKSGNTLQALDQFGTGLADQTYQQAVGNLQNTVATGQAAAAGQAQNVQTGATNLGNIAIGQGNNLANIDANTIAGLTSSIGGAGNQYVEYNTLQNLLNQSPPNNQGAGYGGATGPNE